MTPLEALRACRDRFAEYEKSHAEKGTPDGYAKAARNAEMRLMCEVVIPDLERAPQAPSAETWVQWNGGDYCPVRPDLKVDTRLRKGSESKGPVPARCLTWEHEGSDCDIVAYRIVS